MLRVTDIVVRLGGFSLGVDSLELEPGEYVVVLGPNGAGKTVLLETIAGLHALESGRIEFHQGAGWSDVSSWPPEKRGVGFVYQDYLLFPHLSVAGNIGFGLRSRASAAERSARVREMAALAGVEGLLPRRVGGLSGGEQQKVALARALIIRPRLLLLDEPLAALDRSARREMATEVRRLCRDLGVTALHVTHSLEEAVSLGDRVAVLAQGRLLQVAPPAQLLSRPVDRQVAELVGCENLLAGMARGMQVTVAGGPVLRTAAPAHGEVTVALRAEDLVLDVPGLPTPDSGADRFAALVESLEPGPAHWTVGVRCLQGDAVLKVFVMPPAAARLGLTLGAQVSVSVEPERVRLFG